MSSYEKYKDTIKVTNEARRSAVRVLINNHREEFDALYVEEANKRGLNPTKIVAQIKRVEMQRESAENFSNAVDEKVKEVLSEMGTL